MVNNRTDLRWGQGQISQYLSCRQILQKHSTGIRGLIQGYIRGIMKEMES